MKRESLFDLEVANVGHKESIKKAVRNIGFMNASLKDFGLTIRILAEGDVLKMRDPRLAHDWSNQYDRLFATHGILSVITSPSSENRVIIQPSLHLNIDDTKKYFYPQWNISQALVDITTPGSRLECTRMALDNFNIYYFVMTKTKRWWIGRYGDIPLEHLQLTYRNSESKELDRMMVTSAWYEVNHPITSPHKAAEYIFNIINNGK